MEPTAPEVTTDDPSTSAPQLPAPHQNPDTNRSFERACKPEMEHLHYCWGSNQIENALKYMALATLPWRTQSRKLGNAVRANPSLPTLVIVGQRGTPVNTPPRRNEQYLAASEAARQLQSGRLHLLFTGGRSGLEELTGDKPALTMAEEFNLLTGGVFRQQISVDQFSMNTGHQARLIAQAVHTMGYHRLVICQPVEHIARFAATVAYALQDNGRPYPSMHLFGHGEWTDQIPQREMTRAREAFGPLQDEETAPIPSRRFGGEYADRYAVECDPKRNGSLACPALAPTSMLAYLGQAQL